MRNKFFGSLFLVGISLSAGAQGFYNKGSIVSLSTQAILTVPDSLVNTGTIVNNGDLRISGAWINQGTYDAGTGEINFNSNLPQTINHNDQSFGLLTISGTGEKQFLANITIESELVLQSSNLKSVNGAKLIFDPGAVITGGSDQSHVIGAVEVKGAGDWFFPVGNGTTYLPVEVLDVTDVNASGTLILNELTNETLTGDTELATLSTKRYWELVLNSGNINSSLIRLPLSGEDGLANNTDLLVVAGSDASTNGYISMGQSDLTGNLSSGSITSEKPLTSRFYTIAALSDEPPIEIFNGVSSGNDGKNDYLRIKNIEAYPSNKVSIFNRWGDRVFEVEGYNNLISDKRFNGDSNPGGNKLPAGTYFYSILKKKGAELITGYMEVK
jgi:gliding motility-associated-like protein